MSKTFLIRYYDEEVEIDEFCYFRLELPSELVKSKITYNVEFELFFSDALLALDPDRKTNNTNNLNSVNKINAQNPNNVLNNAEFKSASKQISYINYDSNSPGYIESFIPIAYNDSFFSILNTSIHMVILDYKLRLNNFSAYSCKGNTLPILNQGKEVKKANQKNEENLNSNQIKKNDKNGKINLFNKIN